MAAASWVVSGELWGLVESLLPVKEAVLAIRPEAVPDRQAVKGILFVLHTGITAEIARRNTEHGSGLGHHRWVVERTLAWLRQFKRLLVRYDRRADIHEAFLALGCCLICYRRLQNPHSERSSES